jgi:hypothetical protein
MKFTTEIVVNLPRERMIELFDNPDNMPKWQHGLKSFEPISGEPGQPGAKSRLKYDMNGRMIEMVETIETRNLPDEFSGTYEAKGVWNRVENRFFEDGADKTRWVSNNEFKFSGLMMRAMGFLMPSAFRKQSRKFMEDFKTFAESEG